MTETDILSEHDRVIHTGNREMSRIASKGLVVPLTFFWSLFTNPNPNPPPNNALLANLDMYMVTRIAFHHIFQSRKFCSVWTDLETSLVPTYASHTLSAAEKILPNWKRGTGLCVRGKAISFVPLWSQFHFSYWSQATTMSLWCQETCSVSGIRPDLAIGTYPVYVCTMPIVT